MAFAEHKSDRHFVSGLFSCMVQLLGYKPNLTLDQFFTSGYAIKKMQLVIDLADIVNDKKRYLVK
jgi:hypothetical protein